MSLFIDPPTPKLSEEKIQEILHSMSDRFSAEDIQVIMTLVAGYFRPRKKKFIGMPEIRSLDGQLARLLPEGAQNLRMEFMRRLNEEAHHTAKKEAELRKAEKDAETKQ